MNGDSYRRQWEAAQAYASREGLELDQDLTFHDIGVSAFRGRNAEKGKLALFRRAVEDGVILPGSYLLVEDFDRLSRLDPWDAYPIFQELVNSGINIVTLKDGRIWNTKEIRGNPLRLMEPLFAMWQAHQESEKKGRRIAAVFENKRQRIQAGETLAKPYKHGPAWLRWDPERHEFALVPDRAEIVRDIFRRVEEGWSPDRVARWLNQRDVNAWGDGKRKAAFWRGSYIRKIITNRAAVGTLTMRTRVQQENTARRREKVVGTKDAYFPAVVDQEVFDRIAARMTSLAPRGRNAHAEVISAVAGVAKCSHCAGSVIRVSKGDCVYLVCSRAHAKGGCKYQAVHYSDVERALRDNAEAIFEAAPRGRDTTDIDIEIASCDEHLSWLKDTAKALVEELAEHRSEAVRGQLRVKEAQIADAEKQLGDLRARRDALGAPYVLKRLKQMRDALVQEPFDVAHVNKALRETVRAITVNPEAAMLVIEWQHSTAVTDDIPFYSRHATAFD